MLRTALLLSLASSTAATSCCVCYSYPSCRSYSYSNGAGSNDCSLADAFPSNFPYGTWCADGKIDNMYPQKCQQGVPNPPACNGNGWDPAAAGVQGERPPLAR